MATRGPGDRTSVWPMLVALGAVVACCAGPALLVLAATGLGMATIRSGAVLAGATAAAVLLVAGVVWWRRACACSDPSDPPQASRLRRY
jgi:hypothetical protein